jgi:uncharacterized protein (DUF433 family)
MEKLDRITTDPARMSGEPCIRNLRLTAAQYLKHSPSIPTVAN